MRVLRNARLVDGRHVDVHIDDDGSIASVTDAGSAPADGDTEVDDLGGWLLLPAMAEPHAHLDKALTADEVPNPKGDLMGAITAWFAAAEDGRLSYERTVERATQAFEMLLVHGVTAVRTHINVTADIGISSVLAVQEAAQTMEGLVDFQMVALTGWPMTGPDSGPNIRTLEEAVEAGVNLVGGVPNLQDDPATAISDVLALATAAGHRHRPAHRRDPRPLRADAAGVGPAGERQGLRRHGGRQPLRQPGHAAARRAGCGGRRGRGGGHLGDHPAPDQPVPAGPRRPDGHTSGASPRSRPCWRRARWWPPGPTTCRTRSTWWAAATRWRRPR